MNRIAVRMINIAAADSFCAKINSDLNTNFRVEGMSLVYNIKYDIEYTPKYGDVRDKDIAKALETISIVHNIQIRNANDTSKLPDENSNYELAYVLSLYHNSSDISSDFNVIANSLSYDELVSKVSELLNTNYAEILNTTICSLLLKLKVVDKITAYELSKSNCFNIH